MIKPLVYMILLTAVLLVPVALRQAIHGAVHDVRATSSGNRLVIATPNNRDIRNEFARAFSIWHQAHYGSDVTLDYRSLSGSSDIVRVIKSTYDALRDKNKALPSEDAIADRIEINLVWGGGDSFFESELKPLGVLMPLRLSPATLADIFPQPLLGGVKLYEQRVDSSGKALPPRWVGTCLSSFGIMYNPDVYARLGLHAPSTWEDLDDERLAGMLGLADPTHSGSAAVAYMMVVQHAMAVAESSFLPSHKRSDAGYEAAVAQGFHAGMGTLLLMAANARYFESSATQPPQDVVNGDVAAGVAIDFYARVAAQDVGAGRARFIVPENATAITPDPVAILYGTTGATRELADHFVEFLLSREAQRLWMLQPGNAGGPAGRALRRAPIRQDVYADQTGWADFGNPFTQARSFNMRAEWTALFKSDIRMIWAAAWIDDREELQLAYAKIRAVRDDQRRATLIARLADLPVSLADIRQQQAVRARMDQAGATDAWQAQRRIDWAQTFRNHYRQVASAAEH